MYHKQFFLGLISKNEVWRHIVLIFDNATVYKKCIYSILCLMLSFGSVQVFYESNLLCIVLHDALHVRFRQIIPELIRHTLLNVYVHNIFMNKGL